MKEQTKKNGWLDEFWCWCAHVVFQEKHLLDGLSFEAGDFILLISVLPEPLYLEVQESCGKFSRSSGSYA